MANLSKSKYTEFWKCKKSLWLSKYKPEEAIITDQAKSRMDAGNEVGDLAMGLFGDYTEVTSYKDDKLDLATMIDKTNDELKKGTNVICEASFVYDGNYCAVDILKKENDGYAIYEVKSATDIKDYYIADVAYQKYVLENAGINVTGTYIVYINNQYVRQGELELDKLFKIEDISELLVNESVRVANLVNEAKTMLDSEIEPNIGINIKCGKPNECQYWKYCSKNLPKQSIFDIYKLHIDKKYEYYENGIITYEDIVNNGIELNEKQLRQVEFNLKSSAPYIDVFAIRDFLDTLSYPIYFLDFETMQPAVPLYDGTKPYQQIPFQYSLHYIENIGGELKHKEFLAVSGANPLRPIAESLCENIPMNVCVTAYNKAFECTRLNELASLFPDLSNHLLNIKDNMKDFWDPFKNGYFYKKEFGGSFSIKSVLPGLFPNDPELDYHNLKGVVHNGGEAMTIFPKIQYMPKEEQEIVRESLLRYCELDTYAMVKVWEELRKVSGYDSFTDNEINERGLKLYNNVKDAIEDDEE